MFSFYVTIARGKLSAENRKLLPCTPVLLPASSYYRPAGKRKAASIVQPKLPDWIEERAPD